MREKNDYNKPTSKARYIIAGRPYQGLGVLEVACTRPMTKKTAEKTLEAYKIGAVPYDHYNPLTETGYEYEYYTIIKLEDGELFDITTTY
tara:strand:+ start:90 stop:359 length:270 start_codon:yes stop_codon:yes gene_type:complete